jgi:diamine N-acetyltransferase
MTWADAFGDSLSSADVAAELESTRSEAYFIAALREQTVLVAEDEGALLGYVQFGDVEVAALDAEPGDGAVHRLYVATPWQGRGVGRRLMEAALTHPQLAAARRVYVTVWEQNERALRLYESFGFRAVGTTTFTIGVGEVAEDLVLLLDRRRRPPT